MGKPAKTHPQQKSKALAPKKSYEKQKLNAGAVSKQTKDMHENKRISRKNDAVAAESAKTLHNDESLEFDADDRQADDFMDEQNASGSAERPAKRSKQSADNGVDAAAEPQRISRAEQKALLKERRKHRPNEAVLAEAKEIWEQVRVKRLSKIERRKLVDRLVSLVTGKAKQIIFKHDASRIVQCCIKYGTQEQREKIASELSGEYVQLSQSQYGRFIVSKVMSYCPKSRASVIKEFYGKVRQLIRHKEASIVIDEAYSQYANAAQRASLMEEFYGPEFAVFKEGSKMIGSIGARSGGPRTLQSLLASDPSRQEGILRHLRQAVDSVLQKASFNLSRTPILHRAIYEYLSLSDPAKVSKDMIELLKDHLVHILHTRDGARIAQYCILHGTPKDRKQILKSFKGFVPAIAKEQYGHTVLLSCFECVDDTVVVAKTLLTELLAPVSATSGSVSQTNQTETDAKTPASLGVASSTAVASVSELLRDKYASRVILYLLASRSRRYQPDVVITELAAMDAIRATTSKKDDQVRHKQLLDATAPMLIRAVVSSLNELLRDRIGGGPIIVETINHLYGADGESNASAVIDAIVDLVRSDAIPREAIATTTKFDEDENDQEEEEEKDDDEEENEDDDEEEEENENDDEEEDASKSTASGKPFHAALSLKAERDAKRLAAQGLDMASSILQNRDATLTLKQLVGRSASTKAQKEDKTDNQDAGKIVAWKSTLRASLFDVIAPHFGKWLAHCAQEPRQRSGTALIFLAMLEAAQAVSSAEGIDARDGSSLIAAAQKAVRDDSETDLQELLATAQKHREAASQDSNGDTDKLSASKRKRGKADPKKKTDASAAAPSPIETLLNLLIKSD